MLLIYPPVAKPAEAPAGISRLAGALRAHGCSCTVVDGSLEGLLYLCDAANDPGDTWSIRACRNVEANLRALRDPGLYTNFDRYRRAVADINRVVEVAGAGHGLTLGLANYHDPLRSPLQSDDLLRMAEQPEENVFYPWFSDRLDQLLGEQAPSLIGFSLTYLSQALPTFAMIGFLRRQWPALPIVLGGGLVTSWLRNPAWSNPFGGLVDHLVAGPGEAALLGLLGRKASAGHYSPDYTGLPWSRYLSPGPVLPYAASTGCYWNRCRFCPETAEENPYQAYPVEQVLDDCADLGETIQPRLLHFLDNAVSPSLMRALVDRPPGIPWYAFARISRQLADMEFCLALRRSGCVMLKLGLESGDQGVLDAMDKGVALPLVSRVLQSMKEAGIATYVYLLFGTPSESITEARRTLDFIAKHAQAVTFLNLAIFNMPVCSIEAESYQVQQFYEGDLSLYSDFLHPRGWQRKEVRRFLDREFKRHPAIASILQRDPPIFTSNHAAFFTDAMKQDL